MDTGPLLARPAGAKALWLAEHCPVTPPRLACPTGREVLIHDLIAYVSLLSAAGSETLLPAGQAGEGSRIALATSNLKTSAHVGKPTWGEAGSKNPKVPEERIRTPWHA